ncbi:MAG: hypothetical protein R2748_30690 [Bryobacterales bacterium]
MPSATWKFREKQPAEMHQESAHTEFFANQYVADRLVREVGQNTLDASERGSPARLRFRFFEASPDVFPEYFQPLWPHLQAEKDLRGCLPSPAMSVPVLVVEDFGTTGLTGPLEVHSSVAEKDEPGHRLFWFFKNVGRTSKSGDRLGSFGIGKTVFPFSSRINTFFGFTTRRQPDGTITSALLGQAHLREHQIEPGGADLDPIGFYARHEGAGAHYQQLPITEPDALERFRSAFGLTRRQGETGLSVVIAYPDIELGFDALGQALVDHYFLPILSGKLVAEVHALGGDSILLSDATLVDRAGEFAWKPGEAERVRKRIELASWAFSNEAAKGRIQLAPPVDEKRPVLDEAMLPDKLKTALSQRYLRGERLALRIPTPVERIGAQTILSYVDLFLEHDSESGSSDDIYAREGLTLVDHHGRARQAGLRSILLAQAPEICALLRASENVSHTEWRRRDVKRLTSQYTRGTVKVAFVLELAAGVVQALLAPADKADWWTLRDLFPEPQPSELAQPAPGAGAENENTGAAADGAPTTEEIEVPPIGPAKVRQWRSKPISDGIVLESNPAFSGPVRAMRLTVAYGLPNRTGFTAHRREDFSFWDEAEMVRDHENVSIQAVGDNVLYIRPTGTPFRVEVAGFDPHRALDFRVKTVELETE